MKNTEELLNIQNIASLRIALRIIQDTTPAWRDGKESELREAAYQAVYVLLQHCESKP
jgi:hypothetical protein